MHHASFDKPKSPPVHTPAGPPQSVSQAGEVSSINVTPEDVRQMMVYLRRARERANAIRERAPEGSYMENVLARTIDGISLELAQLDYLLAEQPGAASKSPAATGRMRPAY